MAFDIVLDGKPVGRLTSSSTATRDVPIESPPWHAKVEPKTANEEIVLRLSGEVDLPAGKHRLLLVHRNMVDPHLEKIHVGAGSKQ